MCKVKCLKCGNKWVADRAIVHPTGKNNKMPKYFCIQCSEEFGDVISV
jgi:hypothetical protein